MPVAVAVSTSGERVLLPKSHELPYVVLKLVGTVGVVVIAYLCGAFLRSDARLAGVPGLDPVAAQLFELTAENVLERQWRCDAKSLTPGLPRILLARPGIDGGNGTHAMAVRFPWMPLDLNATDAARAMQECLGNWLGNEIGVVCASSYTFGSTTRALVTRVSGRVAVLWDPVLAKFDEYDKGIELEMSDLAKRQQTYRAWAPRQVNASFYRLLDEEGAFVRSYQTFKGEQAHCAWSVLGL